MSLFSALSIAGSGVSAMQTWIDTTAGNVANMNDAVAVGKPAYGAQTPVLVPSGNQTPGTAATGVSVARVALGTTTGVVTYEPTNPVANAQGNVVLPRITMGTQLVQMMEAQQTYQADTMVMAKAQAAYAAGMTIGA